MKRRQLLKGVFLGLMATPLAGWLVWSIKRTTPQAFIEQVVLEELPYLDIDPVTLARYSADAARQIDALGLDDNQVGMLHIAVSFEDWVSATGWFETERKLLREFIARNFLLATDFFQQGADASRQLSYLGLFDQTRRVCQHPFIRLDEVS